MKYRSALLTDASGSIGGFTASRNRGGLYFRARVVPVNPATQYQVTVRNLMAQCVAAWKENLDDTQRLNWKWYAEFTPLIDTLGSPRVVPALAHYCRSNVPRMQAGLARRDDPPTTTGLPLLTEPTFAVSAATNQVTLGFDNTDLWANETGGCLTLAASRGLSPTVNYFTGPYRFAGKVLGNSSTPPTSPATIDLPFPLLEGQRVAFLLRAITADGRVSSPFRGSVIVAA